MDSEQFAFPDRCPYAVAAGPWQPLPFSRRLFASRKFRCTSAPAVIHSHGGLMKIPRPLLFFVVLGVSSFSLSSVSGQTSLSSGKPRPASQTTSQKTRQTTSDAGSRSQSGFKGLIKPAGFGPIKESDVNNGFVTDGQGNIRDERTGEYTRGRVPEQRPARRFRRSGSY
jgi:hypothetical protein